MKQWYEKDTPLVGRKCFECYHHRTAPCSPCPTLRSLASGVTERNVVPGPAGSAVEWIELFSYPIADRETGEITGVMEFVRDITHQKHLESQLLHAQKMEAVGTLAGGIAHDFNHILLGIQGRASLALLDTNSSHPAHDHLKSIEGYVNSAADLTRQLLGFARGGKYQVQPVNINELVYGASEMFRRARKEIRLSITCDPDVWAVEADRGQIEQVLLNLFVNAGQAMPHGGNLTIETANIALNDVPLDTGALDAGNTVRITVTDTGIGMDENTRKRVFEPFFTTKGMGRGTGLGLASAYGIISNHNGTICVQSEPGKGSTFTVYLPATEALPPTVSRQATGVRGGSEGILLVDDEDIPIDAGRRLLEKLGYRVYTAKSGQEALAVYEAHGEDIHLVVLDLVMPGTAGGETFDRLRQLDPEVKVLLSSGYSINGSASDILSRGCNGFIQKPYNLKRLSREIRNILDRCTSERG